MKLPLIRQDLANHFIYGFAIFFLTSLILGNPLALFITCIVAIGKEVYDHKTTGKFSWMDVMMTLIPGILMIAYQL